MKHNFDGPKTTLRSENEEKRRAHKTHTHDMYLSAVIIIRIV